MDISVSMSIKKSRSAVRTGEYPPRIQRCVRENNVRRSKFYEGIFFSEYSERNA